MLGLVLALLGAAWQYITAKPDVYVLYMSTVSWLHGWYIWTTVLIAVITAIVMFLVLAGLTAIGAEKGGALGAVLGFLGGGALSLIILVLTALSRACLILGSWFLIQALAYVGGEPVWDTVKLIFGCALLLAGLLFGRGSSSSSSSSKN